jgi:hypothetical protein
MSRAQQIDAYLDRVAAEQKADGSGHTWATTC